MDTEKSKVFSIRIPCDLREALEQRATLEGRSLANLVIYLLREAIKRGI